MKPSIAAVLESIRCLVASNVDADVILGVPDDAVPGLYIFPFYLCDDSGLANTSIERTPITQGRRYVIECLLMTSPSTDFATLGLGIDCLCDNWVIEVEKEEVQIIISAMTAEDLGRVFLGSGITQRLAFGFCAQMNCILDAHNK